MLIILRYIPLCLRCCKISYEVVEKLQKEVPNFQGPFNAGKNSGKTMATSRPEHSFAWALVQGNGAEDIDWDHHERAYPSKMLD